MNYIEQYKKLNNEADKTDIHPDYNQPNKPLTIFKEFIKSETIIRPYSTINCGFK